MSAPPNTPKNNTTGGGGGGGGGWGTQQQPSQQQQPHQENPSVIVPTVLANDENNENLNSHVGFNVSVHRFNQNGQPLSVAEFTQHLVERGCAEDWLLRICDRARRNGEGRVRLYYGNGIQTTVIIANANNNDRMAHLSVGLMAQAENGKFAMLPIDNVWEHVQNSQRIVIQTGGVRWGALPPVSGRILRVWPRADSPHTVRRMQVVSSGEGVARMPPMEEVEEAPKKMTKKRKAQDGDKKPVAKKGEASEEQSVFGFSRDEQNELAEAFYADWTKPAAKKKAPEATKETVPDEPGEAEEAAAPLAKPAVKKKAPSKNKTQAAAKETEPEEDKEDEALAASKATTKKKVSSKKKSPVAAKEAEPEPEVEDEAANSAAKKKVPAAAEKKVPKQKASDEPEARWTVFGFSRDEQDELARTFYADWSKPAAKKRKAPAQKVLAAAKKLEPEEGREEPVKDTPVVASEPAAKKKAPEAAKGTEPDKSEEEAKEAMSKKPAAKKKKKEKKAAKGTEPDESEQEAKEAMSKKPAAKKKKEKKASSKKNDLVAKKTAEHK